MKYAGFCSTYFSILGTVKFVKNAKTMKVITIELFKNVIPGSEAIFESVNVVVFPSNYDQLLDCKIGSQIFAEGIIRNKSGLLLHGLNFRIN